MTTTTDRARIAVLVSGSGTNMAAVIARCADGTIPGEVVLVVSSRDGVAALDKAREAGIEAIHLSTKSCGGREECEQSLLARLADARADLIVLAGYMKLVPKNVVASYRGRIVNIHPGPLPRYGGTGMYGLKVHEAVLAAGEKESGPTVHLVDEIYDHGTIIAHRPVPVEPDDTPESLQQRVLEEEHKLLPEVVAAMARQIVAERSGSVTSA